jgi:hypothetical protein
MEKEAASKQAAAAAAAAATIAGTADPMQALEQGLAAA